MKFSLKDFFSKCDQIRKKLLIWPHLQKKYSVENLIFLQWKITIVINDVIENRKIDSMQLLISGNNNIL